MNLIRLLTPRTVATLAVLLCLPAVGRAQSILLSAGKFTVLGGTAITSTGTVGTSIRNGNVGLSPGATTGITGFPPAVIVNGAIISTGAVTAQARLDLITASNGLAGMPSNTNMSTVDLGGKTLAPGVYTFNGAASLNGALVLDAQGKNNVAWVFQIGTALTTAVNSKVTFINLGSNGGSDLGVFWNAGSAITIGANNQIVGNYLAGTSIVIGGLSAVNGRALALAGVSLDTNVVNAHGGFAGADYTGGLFYSLSGAVIPSTSIGGGAGMVTIPVGVFDGGFGTIVGNVDNSGTLSPGLGSSSEQMGAIAVTKNFTQAPTGTLVIQLASATSYDQVQVTGTATLAGRVQVDTLNGYNPLGHYFTFLASVGGVTGQFDTLSSNITTNHAAIAASLVYAPNTVTVVFSQLPFAGFAQTANQFAIANAAQTSPALTAALNEVPLASQFPAALNAISPQGYQVWSDIAFAQATSLADHLLRDDRAVSSHDEYYVDFAQVRGRSRADLDVGSTIFTSTSALVGGNHDISKDIAFGAFVAIGQTKSGLGSAGSKTTVKDRTLGLRAGWNYGPMFAEAMLAYSFNRYTATRPIVFPGTAATATSSTRGHQWTSGITVGQHFDAGKITLSPFGGLLMSRWSANGFTETGAGAFNASVGGQSARSLRSQLGTEARMAFGIFQPHVRAAWLHEFSDKSRILHATLENSNVALGSRRAQRNSALYSAGLDVILGPSALLYADVATEDDGAIRVLSDWRAGLSIRF